MLEGCTKFTVVERMNLKGPNYLGDMGLHRDFRVPLYLEAFISLLIGE